MQIHPNYLYIETCHPIAHKACQNLCHISILNTFPKFQICTHTLAPPETMYTVLKMKKTNDLHPTTNQCTAPAENLTFFMTQPQSTASVHPVSYSGLEYSEKKCCYVVTGAVLTLSQKCPLQHVPHYFFTKIVKPERSIFSDWAFVGDNGCFSPRVKILHGKFTQAQPQG